LKFKDVLPRSLVLFQGREETQPREGKISSGTWRPLRAPGFAADLFDCKGHIAAPGNVLLARLWLSWLVQPNTQARSYAFFSELRMVLMVVPQTEH